MSSCYKIGVHLVGKWTPIIHSLTVFLSPSRRRTAFFLFEHTVEIGAGREAALGRNHIIAIVWLLQNHLFGSLKTYLGKPETEGGIEPREVFGQLRLRDIQRA